MIVGKDFTIVAITKAPGVKCPRCWRVTGEGRWNFDGLCDRCCDVLLLGHPTHPSVPFIQAAYATQRVRWSIACKTA